MGDINLQRVVRKLTGMRVEPSDWAEGTVKTEELGESTVRTYSDKLDYESIEIGGNVKYIRMGCYIYFNLYGSNPIDLAVDRVNERLGRLDNNGYAIRIMYEEDDYGEVYYEVELSKDGVVVYTTSSPEDLRWYGALANEGKSFTNRNKDVEAYYMDNEAQVDIPVDKVFTEKLCPEYLHVAECPICKKKVVTQGHAGNYRCHDCRNKYVDCNVCGEKIERSEALYIHGRYVCEECSKLGKCRACGRMLSDTHSEYENLCPDCGSSYDKRRITDYHSGTGRFLVCSEEDRFKIGFEVEKEDKGAKYSVNLAELLNDTGWTCETDSSLNSDSGFELISPVYKLDIKELEKNFEKISKLLGAKGTDSCGGHIHVSDTERTPYEILLDIKGYLPLLYGLYPRRAGNNYCQALEIESYLNDSHRQAVKVSSKTLEFRIFPLVRNAEQLLFRARIIEYIIKNPDRDVVSVGKKLFNKNSDLYKLLRERIPEQSLLKKANAFIDFTNYLDRDALVVEDNDIKRVIKVPQMKIDKEREFEDRVKGIAEDYRASTQRNDRPEQTARRSYGYAVTNQELNLGYLREQ